MKKYSYTALDKDKNYTTGYLDERSMNRATRKLESDDFVVINIIKSSNVDWGSIFYYSFISRKDKIYFTRHLHNYLEAGITLDRAVSICQEQIENKRFKGILGDIHKNIISGQSLYACLEPYKKIFSPYFVNMIRVGEKSGKLDITLRHLLEKQERESELISKVRGAMIYPAILVIAAIGIVIFMLSFVVPTIAEILNESSTELPMATKILIATSNLLVENMYIIPVMIVLIIAIVIVTLKTKTGKLIYEWIILRTPLLKKIMIEINIAKITMALNAPLQSGLSIDEAIQLAYETSTNEHYRNTLKQGRYLVRKGVPLSDVLKGNPRIYPPNVLRMIELGEETGKTTDMLSKLSDFYQKSVNYTLSNLSTIIEPFLLLFIGFVVGFIAVSILTPIWKLAEAI